MRHIALTTLAAATLLCANPAGAAEVELGPRPYFLVQQMAPSALKERLLACADHDFEPTLFSIGHRGAPLMFPEQDYAQKLIDEYKAAGVPPEACGRNPSTWRTCATG